MTNKRLIVFTRYPQPFNTKTRLIPQTGAKKACLIQKELTENTLAMARRLKLEIPLEIEVRLPDNLDLAAKWLGEDLAYQKQGTGNLGITMNRALKRAFNDGMDSCVLVGSDIPELNNRILGRAFEALKKHDLVLGPAKDGGYYLIGFKNKVIKNLLTQSNWAKYESILKIAKSYGKTIHTLEEISDLDEPEDLDLWEQFKKQKKNTVSVIIPTLNEEKRISKTISQALSENPLEIICADASTDKTKQIARDSGALVIPSPRGRGNQMNLGSQHALGEYLLFCHADTKLPNGYTKELIKILNKPGVSAGAFSFKLDQTGFGLKLIEKTVSLRCKYANLPYGDQAIFIKTRLFRDIGGFRNQPIMEDWELIKKLKKKGKIAISSKPVIISARRWVKLGVLRTTFINYLIPFLYTLKVPPARLYQLYYGKKKTKPK